MAIAKSHIEIAYSSIKVFADDGKLDMGELNFLLGLALRDNEVDDDEKRVLRNVFEQAEQGEIDPAVQERINQVRIKYGI